MLNELSDDNGLDITDHLVNQINTEEKSVVGSSHIEVSNVNPQEAPNQAEDPTIQKAILPPTSTEPIEGVSANTSSKQKFDIKNLLGNKLAQLVIGCLVSISTGMIFTSVRHYTLQDMMFVLISHTLFGIFLYCRYIIGLKSIKDTKVINIIVLVLLLFIYTLGIKQLVWAEYPLIKVYVYQYIHTWLPLFLISYLLIVHSLLQIILEYAQNIYNGLFKTSKKRPVSKTTVPDRPNSIEKLVLTVGEVHDPDTGDRKREATLLNINKTSLFTNLYVTGSIGTGKTVFLCSILDQLLSYQKHNPNLKPAGLFIDEKGSLAAKVAAVAEAIGRSDDLYIFTLEGNVIYNPIHEPKKDAEIIANRLKKIMESTVEKEAWIANYCFKFLHNAINLCRLTSEDYYVTLLDLYSLIFTSDTALEKLNYLARNKDQIIRDIKRLDTDISDIVSIEYLEVQEVLLKNYFIDTWDLMRKGDSNKMFGIVSSALTLLLGPFTNYRISHIFSPESPEQINFKGFDWMINEGKLFCFAVPDSLYEGLGKFIALFLKLPFQNTCLARIPKITPGTENYDPGYNKDRVILFVADENQNSYHPSDNDSLDKMREAKVVSICLTQNFVSLLAKHNNENQIRQYLGSFRNKLFLATDDDKSAKFYSELCGEKKTPQTSRSWSESSKDANIDLVQGEVVTSNTNLNESVTMSERLEHNYEYSEFLNLKKFQGIFTGYDGISRIDSQVVYVKPSWIDWHKDWFSWIEQHQEESIK